MGSQEVDRIDPSGYRSSRGQSSKQATFIEIATGTLRAHVQAPVGVAFAEHP